MRLRILDGATTVGGTKIYLESQGTGLLLDFGINYKRWGLYFEEYLQPRAARGILDLLALGLALPVGGIYRPDLFPQGYHPDLPELPVEGILISHAHLDHCGLLGLLRPEIPVHASALTAAVMKAVQESGQLDYYSEMAYINPRLPREADPRALRGADWRKGSYQGRRWVITDRLSGPIKEFLTSPPNPRGRRLAAQPVEEAAGHLAKLAYRAFPVDHSIPGASAYAVETDRGWVVYTGDLRLHGGQAELTEAFVAAARALRPYLLIIEGTRAGVAGPRTSEAEVYENALRLVREHAGELVLADFGPRNIERLKTFLMIAQATGRRLLVLAKDAHLLGAIAAAAPEWDLLQHPALGIFDEVKVEPQAWEEQLRERYPARLVPLEEVHRAPGEFVLAFSYWDLKHLLDLAPRGGLYIYSSSESYTEEQEIDMRRLWNWLEFFRFDVAGFFVEGDEPRFPEGLHASGHASGADLLWLAREISPQFLLPVHTERPEFFHERLRGEPIRVLPAREGEEVLK
ncbi:MAG: MBL fold metallo-hydrolase [Candidatus Acetothermia bacterium]|jgi:ribonuclease J|nr:MBL fold metallo-hydrolase [Candidatus Acetothermia bacterium]MDH7505822.1 MBL fold metallo-hydrolase [Candidatus Acetothermia bacterium]